MMARLLLVAAMAVDLGTFLAVPPEVRAAAESNALVPYVSPVALKIGAVAVILALLTRLTTRSPVWAIRIAAWITVIGAVSNLRGLV